MKKPLALALVALTLGACSGGTPADAQRDNRNRAMLEHNEVSLDLQRAWGSQARSPSEQQVQRAWEEKMRQSCHPADESARIGGDLNAIYCEINAMRERQAGLQAR